MTSVLDIRTEALHVAKSCIYACEKMEKGVLWLGERASRTLVYIYNPKGLAALSKVLISSIELACLVDATAKGVFGECLKNLKAFKDVLYSTFWVISVSDLITTPKYRKDIVKVLNCAGDFFEFFKFLEKNGICSFSLINAGANFCNSWRIKVIPFSWGECPAPVNPFCERPKDFFIFWSSIIDVFKGIDETYKWIQKNDPNKQVDFGSIVKRTGSLGKIILIPFGNASIGLSIIDNITQLASLVKLIIDRENQRTARLAQPIVIDVVA